MADMADIIKSENDNRIYHHFQLNNKLNVLIIHDPDGKAKLSGASLCVNVGYYQDPENYQGLAHFLEHMLFMGTSKFSKENIFQEFVNKHGGTTNAFTTNEYTNYFFDIDSKYLQEALKIFSHFFVSPLFNEEAVDREIHAVDSEHNKNYANDNWRLLRILKEVSQVKPFYNFSTGNLETLNKPHIRQELIKFFKTHYSSDKMNLVVYTTELSKDHRLEHLKELIKNHYEQIPIRNDVRIKPKKLFTFKHKQGDVPFSELARFIPVQRYSDLYMLWQFDKIPAHFIYKPIKYIFHLLCHESEGSVVHLLRKLGLATTLSGEEFYDDSKTIIHGVVIRLTDKGFYSLPTVVDMVNHYINIIKDQGIQDWIYNEHRIMGQINFKYLVRMPIIDYVSMLSIKMFEYPKRHILDNSYYYNVYNEHFRDVIFDYLKLMTRDKSIIVISSDLLKKYDQFFKTEKIYNIKYLITGPSDGYGPIPHKIKYDEKKLHLPHRNKYIPSKIPSALTNAKELEFPILCNNPYFEKVYYKPANNFPKIMFSMIAYSDMIQRDLFTYTMFRFYEYLFHYETNSESYYGLLAGCQFSISTRMDCVEFHIESYPETIEGIITHVVDKFINLKFIEDAVDLMQIKYMDDLRNAIYDLPFNQSIGLLMEKSYKKYYSPKEQYDEMKIFRFEDIARKENLKEIWTFVGLIQGNIKEKDCAKLLKPFNKLQQKDIDHRPQLIVDTLGANEEEIYIHNLLNEKEKDSVIHLFFEIGLIKKDWKKVSKILILESLIKEKFYDELRTKQVSGYIVKAFMNIIGLANYPVYGMSLAIQSSKKSLRELKKNIKKFIADTEHYIQKLSKEHYNDYVNGIINILSEKDTNIYHEFGRNLSEIKSGDFNFDRQELLIKAIKTIKKSEIEQFYADTFINRNTRKVRIIYMIGQNILPKKIDIDS